MASTLCVRHAQPRGRPRNSRRWQLLYIVQLRWRWHKLLLIDRNSLVIIYVVKLRLAFHNSSFPRFSVSRFPPPTNRSRIFQSCIFHFRSIMPRFPVSRFPPMHFWWCRVFRSHIFSCPDKLLQLIPVLVSSRPTCEQCATELLLRVPYSSILPMVTRQQSC